MNVEVFKNEAATLINLKRQTLWNGMNKLRLR